MNYKILSELDKEYRIKIQRDERPHTGKVAKKKHKQIIIIKN